MALGRRRIVLADAAGLALILLVLLDLLHPSLLLLPTITAGGDTPCHYPTAVWFREHLLPRLRLHGWYPGAYLGQPLLLYYFPFPFLLMAALAPVAGMPVAFKLGTALGVFLLPPLAYLALRRMRLPFPAPLLGAATALVFLYVEDNPIWGGTIASTLAGEFSYTYAVGFALLFLGELLRARQDGRGPWLPAAALALTCYAHGYAVLWAGLTASGLLLWERRPLRTLGWLAAVAGLAFALAAPSLLPLLGAWGWTTPYDDAWIDVTTRGLLPALLWPQFLCAVLGLAWMAFRRFRGAAVDRRLLLLAWGAVAGAALTCAGPGLGVIDVRFAPFAQLSLALCGAAALGLALARLALPDVAALACVLLAIVLGDGSSRYLRSWVDWNYSGLEAKELWPAWKALSDELHGGVADPRVAVEYDPLHEKAGSIRMYETLPYFSGRSTLEGVYNQASPVTHPVYYLASELFARSPNPFRSRSYSQFDPQSALERVRLFDVGAIVATSPALAGALARRDDVEYEASIPPYTVFRLRDPGPGYVEPLAFEPVRVPLRGWRDACYHWFTRKPANRALLVFTDDPRFALTQADPWAPPAERPLPGGVHVRAAVEAEQIRIETDRPGHPLLVKLSYHPRWRAEGAAGPYLVSPGLMLVVPQQREVRLRYVGRSASDWTGLALALLASATLLRAAVRRREGPTAGPSTATAEHLRTRVLHGLPVALALAIAALRLLPAPSPAASARALYERASRAYADQRWDAAAELARAAGTLAPAPDPRRLELLCLEGEALLAGGHPRQAALAFTPVVEQGGPHQAEALYSGARALAQSGEPARAREWRQRLREAHPDTPWATRLAEDERRATTASSVRAGAPTPSPGRSPRPPPPGRARR
ncbi:MAG TPA: 6-pyruvoyl-tetrahydropterin synthase-related protein [Vicinamibacteria bacterium]|nr:6-pyruvoyl-tetrahydropterin synthase-related protein [Vicinamibacteria bacterium]